MNAALHTYSGILQLRRDAIAAALGSPHGIAYSLRLFVIVLLIAGLGIWFGLPATLRQPTLTEQVDKVTSQVRDAGLDVVARVIPMVTDVKDIPRTVANYLEQYAGPYVRMFGNLTGRLSTDVGDANQLLKQANVSTNEVMQLVQTTQVTPEQLGQLLARTNATPEQIQMIAVAANLALPQVQDQVRANLSTSAQNAISELQPMLKKLSMTAEQLQQTLALLSTTPEQFNDLRKALSLTSDQLGEFLVMLKATPERLNQLAVQIHNETVKMEPAVGAGPSRVIYTFGQWLSTPLEFAASWLWFVLVLLVVARSIGGKATVGEHVGAAALAVAPAVLLLGAYIPDMTGTVSAPVAVAIATFGRVVALVGIVWCVAVLIKTMATAHNFGMWKSIGAVALTIVVIYVVAPLMSLLAAGYLVRG